MFGQIPGRQIEDWAQEWYAPELARTATQLRLAHAYGHQDQPHGCSSPPLVHRPLWYRAWRSISSAGGNERASHRERHADLMRNRQRETAGPSGDLNADRRIDQ